MHSSGLTESYAVRAVSVYCVVGYVVIQILYLGVWCRPVDMYWAVPVPPDKGAHYTHNPMTSFAWHIL